MLKILIIGSSQIIKNTFKKKYNKSNITFIKFRKVWIRRNINKFDIIILSGFHRSILSYDMYSLDKYINKYKNFILQLSQKTDNLFVISTFIPNKLSFSRIVYFYKNLLPKIFKKKNIKILSFRKIISKVESKKNIFFILKFLKIKMTDQNALIKNTNRFQLNKIPNPKSYFLNIPRNMIIERILRLFDK